MRNRNDNTRNQSDNVCLPCLSHFSYKSTLAHVGIILSSTATIGLFAEAALLLVLAQYSSSEYLREQIFDIGLKVGASGLGAAAITTIGFFAGTTRDLPTEVDEASQLVQHKMSA